MANSGSFDTTHRTSGSYDTYARFSWSLKSQSIENNTSTIDWNFKGKTANSYQWMTLYGSGVTVDGESHSGWTGKMYEGTTLYSGTKTISHGADGTKTFSASGWIKQYSSGAANNTGSGSWTLPTIARQANLSTVQSFDDTGNPTITYTNDAGNSVTTLQACIASTNGQTVYAAYRNVNKTGTLSYTFNLTTTERNTLLAACPSSNTLNVRFYLKTVIGSNTFYSNKEAVMTVVNGNPTFTNFSFADTNSTITGITGNNQILVQGKSTLVVTVSSANKAVANKSATMANYVASLSGKSVQADYSSSGNTLTFTDNAFSSGSQLLSVKATDSRNNSTTVTKNVTVLAYANPVINATATRRNNFENETTLTFTGSISPLTIGSTNKNALKNVSYRYKSQSTTTWGSWTAISNVTTASNGTLTIPNVTLSLANNQAWDFEVRAVDKLITTTKAFVVSVGQPAFFIGSDGRTAVGGTPSIAKPSGNAGQLEVKGDTYTTGNAYAGGKLLMTLDRVYPVGSIFMSTTLATADAVKTALGGGTWEAWGAGRFVAGIGEVDANNDDWCGHTSAGDWTANPNSKGGETYHTLTVDEMPSHRHITGQTWKDWKLSGSGNGPAGTYANYGSDTWSLYTGGGQAHNNMPPYITVYMWKRTA